MPEILFIALSLAMDAMAVSVSAAAAYPQGGRRQALRLGLWFGAFQFAMPLLGFLLGQGLLRRAAAFAPFLAFGLLGYLGGKMLWDSFAPVPLDLPQGRLTTPRVFLLAVATSLDALASGVSAACMALPLWLSCAVIGLAAFCLSALGAALGRRLGLRLRRVSGGLGGAGLIAIGLKFLLQSL